VLLTSVNDSETSKIYPNNNEALAQELEGVKESLKREAAYRCRLEAELREARAATIAAQQARDSFQRAMAHKLRSPLNVILGFSEYLLDGDLEKEVYDGLKLIDKGARSLHPMIDGSLQLTQLECETNPLHYDEADLHQLVGCEIEILRHDENLKVPILLEESACTTKIKAETNLINQLIRNLLDNAIRYSPKGGQINCRIEKVAGGRLRFSISDRGSGIPKKSLEQIFDNFMGSGRAGIGLALCREIIRLHNGRIWAENNKEEGATFFFEIPTRVKE